MLLVQCKILSYAKIMGFFFLTLYNQGCFSVCPSVTLELFCSLANVIMVILWGLVVFPFDVRRPGFQLTILLAIPTLMLSYQSNLHSACIKTNLPYELISVAPVALICWLPFCVAQRWKQIPALGWAMTRPCSRPMSTNRLENNTASTKLGRDVWRWDYQKQTTSVCIYIPETLILLFIKKFSVLGEYIIWKTNP